MLSIINSNISPVDLQKHILEEFAISTEVKIIDGKTSILLKNHFSLFTIINKIRGKQDFRVLHKKDKNNFILQIL